MLDTKTFLRGELCGDSEDMRAGYEVGENMKVGGKIVWGVLGSFEKMMALEFLEGLWENFMTSWEVGESLEAISRVMQAWRGIW